MKQVKILRKNDNHIIIQNCDVAETMWERMKGLLGRSYFEYGQGLWLEPCNSIHTFFMKFAIDAVYVSDGGKILWVHRHMQPWRLDLPVFGARAVLELPSGAAQELHEGDVLCFA